MKDAIKDALTRLLSSMKFWTMVLGLAATFLAKYGIKTDASTAEMVAAGFGILLGAQGLTDHGKAAAEAAACPTCSAAPEPVVAKPVKVVKNKRGMATVETLILLFGAAAFAALVACGAVSDCKKPEQVNTVKCVAINAVIDCTKGEIPNVILTVGPVVEKVISESTGADGSVDWAHVEKTIVSLGPAYGACVLGAILHAKKSPKAKHEPGIVEPTEAALRDGLNRARTLVWKIDPAVKIRTEQGDL